MTEKYNGWMNYETWAANLWISNDAGSDSYWSSMAEDAYENAESSATFSRKEEAAFALAETLKEEHEQNAPECEGFYSDLLTAALSEVNWNEIAEYLLSEIEEEETVE